MTTKSLQSLIDKASALPAELQEQFARQWLAELENEALWDEQFAGSQSVLEEMAKKALEKFREGKTIAKGWDEI
ncbi:MAG TPA: hypothetical protein VH253_16370 [Phycisphaerae bacterium]|nr:hypothetical protein [Phycisphaerae bacterium]